MDEECEVGSFEAEDDEGQHYTVIEWQRFSRFQTLKEGERLVPGNFRLALITGENVNALKDGSFQIVDNDVIIRKVG